VSLLVCAKTDALFALFNMFFSVKSFLQLLRHVRKTVSQHFSVTLEFANFYQIWHMVLAANT